MGSSADPPGLEPPQHCCYSFSAELQLSITEHFLSFHSCRCPYLTSGTRTFELFLRFSLGHRLRALGQQQMCCEWQPHVSSGLSPITAAAWNDYIQMTCLFCFWQPYRGNVAATTHDPPLVFPKPQAVPKGCPLSDAHHRKPTRNHEARTPLNGWNGWPYRSFPASEALWFYSEYSAWKYYLLAANSRVSVKASGSWVFLEWYFIFLVFDLLKDTTYLWWLSWLANCVTSSHILQNNTHCILKITENNLCEWCKDMKPSSVCGLHLHCGELKFPWLSPVFEV